MDEVFSAVILILAIALGVLFVLLGISIGGDKDGKDDESTESGSMGKKDSR